MIWNSDMRDKLKWEIQSNCSKLYIDLDSYSNDLNMHAKRFESSLSRRIGERRSLLREQNNPIPKYQGHLKSRIKYKEIDE